MQNTVVKYLIDIGVLLSLAFGAYFYFVSTFVEASEFKNYQIREYEDRIFELEFKKELMIQKGSDLTPLEKAKLKRMIERVRQIQQGN